MKEKPTEDCNKINASESSYLYVSLSQLPDSGNGLFSTISIYKDEIIAVFKGEHLTNNQAHLRTLKQKDKYFILLADGSILDSMKTKCFAKFANDVKGSTKPEYKNNAKIALDESENVCLVATRKINKGEEIFCNYGSKYWKNQNDTCG